MMQRRTFFKTLLAGLGGLAVRPAAATPPVNLEGLRDIEIVRWGAARVKCLAAEDIPPGVFVTLEDDLVRVARPGDLVAGIFAPEEID